MRKNIAIFLIILLLLPNLAMAKAEQAPVAELDIKFFEEILDYIQKKYPFDIKEDTLIDGGLRGMLQAVDNNSNYYSPDEVDSTYRLMTGEFVGIGIYFEEKDGYMNIVDIMPGEPADRAGLKKDDVIISINKEDIKDYGSKKSTSMISGPVGTEVELGIKRKDEILNLQVVRENIYINPVKFEILEDNIGYIDLEEFTETGTRNLKTILKDFDNKNIENVILDLRNNPGGLLSEAIKTAELFVPKGPIVHIREKDQALVSHLSSLEKCKYKLVVLINGNSASASEIVAGAVQDRKSGALVGTRTYGKGTVQNLMPLSNGGLIKLTIAEYLTPNKTSINGKGIQPDYEVENAGKEDLQMKKAIKLLK